MWVVAAIFLVWAAFAINGWRIDRHQHRYDLATIAHQYEQAQADALQRALAETVAEAEHITRQAAS